MPTIDIDTETFLALREWARDNHMSDADAVARLVHVGIGRLQALKKQDTIKETRARRNQK